tara:strand:- start:15 stop:401 length:387 start_codon:yes stop_codon:yes gene_type:complete
LERNKMPGPAAPLVYAILSYVAKEGLKAAVKKYGPKEVKKAQKLVTKYKKTLDAEDQAADYNYRSNKARVTRSNNSLNKEITDILGPDASSKDKINIRTLLQNTSDKFNKGGLVKKGHTDHRKKGMFR